MKKKILKIITLLLLIAVLVGLNGGIRLTQSTVRAVGDLSVDWGVAEGDPIFVVEDFAPGEIEEREVKIINNADTIRPVGVRGIETEETDAIGDKLWLTVSLDGNDLYGGTQGTKTLNQFFEESGGPDSIPLFNLTGGLEKSLIFKVEFDADAGNEFQAQKLVFDLRIGIAINIPDDCLGMVFNGDPIFGTIGDDNIRGTNKNDLIYGFEGNDKVQSSNGHDCVIGGPGNDEINNSNGNDVLFGSEGNDKLYGSNGNDIIFGGPGDDFVSGSNGQDQLSGEGGDDEILGSNGDDRMFGGEGLDQMSGSNGNDLMEGGAGNDKLDGSNGIDTLLGQEGDDILAGGNGNDNLDGGGGIDAASGNLGRDTCQAEIKNTCEL